MSFKLICPKYGQKFDVAYVCQKIKTVLCHNDDNINLIIAILAFCVFITCSCNDKIIVIENKTISNSLDIKCSIFDMEENKLTDHTQFSVILYDYIPEFENDFKKIFEKDESMNYYVENLHYSKTPEFLSDYNKFKSLLHARENEFNSFCEKQGNYKEKIVHIKENNIDNCRIFNIPKGEYTLFVCLQYKGLLYLWVKHIKSNGEDLPMISLSNDKTCCNFVQYVEFMKQLEKEVNERSIVLNYFMQDSSKKQVIVPINVLMIDYNPKIESSFMELLRADKDTKKYNISKINQSEFSKKLELTKAKKWANFIEQWGFYYDKQKTNYKKDIIYCGESKTGTVSISCDSTKEYTLVVMADYKDNEEMIFWVRHITQKNEDLTINLKKDKTCVSLSK